MINEDTGEEPTCVVCGGEWTCERHLVACLDLTFGECFVGALYERDHAFWSRIEDAFMARWRSGNTNRWADEDIQLLWEQIAIHPETGPELDRQFVFALIDRLLERAGGLLYPGGAVDEDSVPGNSSSYSLLYAEAPEAVVGRAQEILDEALKS